MILITRTKYINIDNYYNTVNNERTSNMGIK